MRILKIAVIAALAFTGLAASAYADGFEPGTTSLRVPINGRTNQQICRAVQTLGILPGSINACVREARANREDGWVTLTALSGPMQIAEPTAAPGAPEPPAADPATTPVQTLVDPPDEGGTGDTTDTGWTPTRDQQILIGVLIAALVLGAFAIHFFRKKPEDVAVVAEEDET